jgi:hypothetical protein
MPDFKFLILAAGRGTRNQSIRGLHKGLLPLGNRAILSHLFDYVPRDVEIVIACGYKKEQLIGYVEYMHPDRNVQWVHVDKWEGKGSGPGYSMLKCKDLLQCPFIHIAVDTIIDLDRPFSSVAWDWIGCASVPEEESGRYFLVEGDRTAKKLYYGTGDQAYIGVAGIRNYKAWWDRLEAEKKAASNGEFQVTCGFAALKSLDIRDFHWHDTGTTDNYKALCEKYGSIVAEKTDEAIFFEGNRVVKYFADASKAEYREKRAESLKGLVPDVVPLCGTMYGYEKVNGFLLSENTDTVRFHDFLTMCQTSLWSKAEQSSTFRQDCQEMYRDKATNRCKVFQKTYLDAINNINGIDVMTVSRLLARVPWRRIYARATPSVFHGDLQPENVICCEYNRFKLIDWRESFGQSHECGDRYYDLSKIHHALVLSGQVLLHNEFYVSNCAGRASIEWRARSNLLDFMDTLKEFCEKNKYDYDIVEWLSYMHYLAIASLYRKESYRTFLFLLGKYLLSKKVVQHEKAKQKSR